MTDLTIFTFIVLVGAYVGWHSRKLWETRR